MESAVKAALIGAVVAIGLKIIDLIWLRVKGIDVFRTISTILVIASLVGLCAALALPGLDSPPPPINSEVPVTPEEIPTPPPPATPSPQTPTPPPTVGEITGLTLLSDAPSDADVDAYGDGLHYPAKTEYLDAYEIRYVDAPNYSVYGFSSHRSDRKKQCDIIDGDQVVVLAKNENNGFSCVVLVEAKKAVWVNSSYVVATMG